MDATLIAAMAGIGGSLIGGITSFASTYITQRHQVRRERLAKELDRREALYGSFINEAGNLFVDSLDKGLDDVAGLVRAGSMFARIRLTAEPMVVASGQALMNEIIAAYGRPPVPTSELITQAAAHLIAPMSAFTDACRAERDAMLRAL